MLLLESDFIAFLLKVICFVIAGCSCYCMFLLICCKLVSWVCKMQNVRFVSGRSPTDAHAVGEFNHVKSNVKSQACDVL